VESEVDELEVLVVVVEEPVVEFVVDEVVVEPDVVDVVDMIPEDETVNVVEPDTLKWM
jgi:hypothetical protein